MDDGCGVGISVGGADGCHVDGNGEGASVGLFVPVTPGNSIDAKAALEI